MKSENFVLATILANAPFNCSSNHEHIYGDYQSINWKSLDQLAAVISDLIVRATPAICDAVRPLDFVTYHGNLAYAGVDILSEQELDDSSAKKMQELVTALLHLLTRQDANTQDLFENIGRSLSAEDIQHIREVADQFLSGRGDKPVQVPATVLIGKARLPVLGKYAAPPPVAQEPSKRLVFDAIIDGICISKSQVTLLADGIGTKKVAYDDERFFDDLHGWLKTREMRRAVVDNRQLADGSWVLTLTGFERDT